MTQYTEKVTTKISSQELTFVDQNIETVYEKKFVFADKETEEATKIKYTIRKCLDLFRDIFSADACYLYLINEEMDPDEKREILNERIKEMNEAFDKEIAKSCEGEEPSGKYAGLILPQHLGEPKVEDVKILKFIDISQKMKEDGTYYWNYDYRRRPRKYVVFSKDLNNKEISDEQEIYGEGITAFIFRNKKHLVNNKSQLNRNLTSASLNSKHNIKRTSSTMSIGIPLLYKKGAIGVITIEFYDKNKEYEKKEYNIDEKIKEAESYIPLLVQIIIASKTQFSEDSYHTLFGGMELLKCLKKIGKDISNDTSSINWKIYKDTLHLFYVLKRKEYVGYEEILERIAGYANDISKYLGLSSDSKRFTDFLEKFKKHEELLLYGLSDFRDHFMHQFHVFIIGYIIINLIGFKEFEEKIESSMELALGKSKEHLNISERNVLRTWFLVSFFHDHAYIFQKIDYELQNFFKSAFDQEFIVSFNWEQLLKKGSKFPTHLTNLQNFFNKQGQTNPDVLMRNYLDSIISSHDHGVLSALLLLNYFSDYENISSEYGSIKNDCLYAAFAISVHNRYENLMENGLAQISFESFPIAFLLSYCDTAQSFGRVGKRQEYRSRFLDINFDPSEKTIVYKIEYLDEKGKRIPSPEIIEGWANKAHNTFKSSKYFFEIENYEVEYKDDKPKPFRRPICTLSYGFYKQP